MFKSNDPIARAVTSGPMHHFFGYYGIQPWDADEKYLLCLETLFHDHVPHAEDKATFGVACGVASRCLHRSRWKKRRDEEMRRLFQSRGIQHG